MDALKRFTEISLSPIGVMVVLMTIGLILSLFRRDGRSGHRLLLAGSFLYLIFLFSPISEILIQGLEENFTPLLVPPPDLKIERIVVLSGYGEDRPSFPITSNLSTQTVYSLVEGLRLYRVLPGSKLILSGGVLKRGQKPVAKLMAEFLRQMGVPEGDTIVEGKSTTTFENLACTKALVGTKPFILVATACDLRRAVAVAHKCGMQPVPAPAWIWALQSYPAKMTVRDRVSNIVKGFAYPSQDRLARLQWAYHEYLGYAWYSLLGRV